MIRQYGAKTLLSAGSALVLLLSLGLPAPPAAATPGAPSILAASPGNYIAAWKKRGRSCKDEVSHPPWTDWVTYAGAEIGIDWAITANRRKLCDLAANTANRLIESLPFNDGAGFKKIDWQGYAITVGEGRTDDPIGHDKPKGWSCFALPSAWGASAWQYAEMAGLGSPNDSTFGPASGPAAGCGYCVTGASSDAQGIWHGGNFLTWVPDVLRCGYRYHLKETPVPGEPYEVTYPSYAEAQIWGDYERGTC